MFFKILIVIWLVIMTLFNISMLQRLEDPNRKGFKERLRDRLQEEKLKKNENK